MTKVNYRAGSPWAATSQENWYLDNMRYRDIRRDATDELITLESRYQFRPYNLSFDKYGSRDYWWVFMQLNMNVIRDPIYDFVTGIQIFVPTKDRLLASMGTKS